MEDDSICLHNSIEGTDMLFSFNSVISQILQKESPQNAYYKELHWLNSCACSSTEGANYVAFSSYWYCQSIYISFYWLGFLKT